MSESRVVGTEAVEIYGDVEVQMSRERWKDGKPNAVRSDAREEKVEAGTTLNNGTSMEHYQLPLEPEAVGRMNGAARVLRVAIGCRQSARTAGVLLGFGASMVPRHAHDTVR